jgi:hypothetical protein
LELGRASKEGSKKERRTSQLPQDKSKTLKANPPLCLSTITFWWMIIKWDFTEPKKYF